MMSNIRKRVRDIVEPVPAIYDDMVSSLRTPEWDENTEAVVTGLPTFYSSRSALYRQRSKLLPTLPKSRTETSAGDNFLLANEGQEEKILIFGTVEYLMELSAADTWYMDGTFYSSPTCFYQLYTIHALINGYMCPLVFGLLPNKSEDTYRRFFRLLQNCGDNNNIRLVPTTIMIDFECAARSGVKDVFPTVTVRGCHFHITQCLWRKVQAGGLVQEYKNNEEFKTLVRRAGALALVPVHSVEEACFQALEDCDSDLPAVIRFCNYVTERWIEGNKEMWNHVDNSGPRTTNHVVGWHNKINSILTHANPNIYRLIELLQKEQSVNEIRLL